MREEVIPTKLCFESRIARTDEKSALRRELKTTFGRLTSNKNYQIHSF